MCDLIRHISPLFKSIWLFIAWVPSVSQAEQPWSLLTSASYNTGQYIYENTIQNYYFNLGLRYRSPNWTFSVSFPMLAQRTNMITTEPQSSEMSMGSDLLYTLGDLYLFGEGILWQGTNKRPIVALSTQVKAPVGLAAENMSSNKLDIAGNIVIRQTVGKYNAFADVGYLSLGDPVGINYKDPLSFGIGFGRIYKSGKYSTSLYYKAYGEILPGIAPPQQVTLGWYYRLNQQTYFSLYMAQGLSESSPDQSVSVGLSKGL